MTLNWINFKHNVRQIATSDLTDKRCILLFFNFIFFAQFGRSRCNINHMVYKTESEIPRMWLNLTKNCSIEWQPLLYLFLTKERNKHIVLFWRVVHNCLSKRSAISTFSTLINMIPWLKWPSKKKLLPIFLIFWYFFHNRAFKHVQKQWMNNTYSFLFLKL